MTGRTLVLVTTLCSYLTDEPPLFRHFQTEHLFGWTWFYLLPTYLTLILPPPARHCFQCVVVILTLFLAFSHTVVSGPPNPMPTPPHPAQFYLIVITGLFETCACYMCGTDNQRAKPYLGMPETTDVMTVRCPLPTQLLPAHTYPYPTHPVPTFLITTAASHHLPHPGRTGRKEEGTPPQAPQVFPVDGDWVLKQHACQCPRWTCLLLFTHLPQPAYSFLPQTPDYHLPPGPDGRYLLTRQTG